MPTEQESGPYQHPHIRIEQFRQHKNYTPPPRRIDGNVPTRNNVRHGAALSRQFSAAFARARKAVAAKRKGTDVPGVYLEVVSAPNQGLTT